MVKRENQTEDSRLVHSKTKKPIHKRWWFIVLAVIVLGRTAIDMLQGTDAEEVVEVAEVVEVIEEPEEEVIEADNDEESEKEKAEEEAKEKAEQEQLAKEKAEQDAQEKEQEQQLAEEKAEQKAKAKEEKEAEKERLVKEKEAEQLAEEKEEKRLAEEKAEQDMPYELVDGVALFTDDSSIGWSVGSHIDIFSYDMAQLLIEHHADITNGAVFRSVKSLVDSYGNEANYNVIVVYYSQDTIEKINYANWPTLDTTGLYTTADALFAHPAFKERGVAQNVSAPETAPSLYFNLLGTEVD